MWPAPNENFYFCAGNSFTPIHLEFNCTDVSESTTRNYPVLSDSRNHLFKFWSQFFLLILTKVFVLVVFIRSMWRHFLLICVSLLAVDIGFYILYFIAMLALFMESCFRGVVFFARDSLNHVPDCFRFRGDG